MSSLIMWITFCQETKVDKTTSFLRVKANAFKKFVILVYLTNGKIQKVKKIKKKEKTRVFTENKNSWRQKSAEKQKKCQKEKINGLVMLKKQNRLSKITRKKADKLFTFPLFNVRVSDNGEETARFAFIVSKKIDKRAVVRNKTKRVLRNAVGEILGKLNGGRNIVIVAKKALIASQKEAVTDSLEEVFKKVGLIK